MKQYRKTTRLDNVGYEIRGPVAEEALRMMSEGINVIQLNTGNPAAFGIFAPDFVGEELREAMRAGQPYSESGGVTRVREAIAAYCARKDIQGVSAQEVFTGNGVSEMITIAVQALLNDGDEVLLPTPDYPLWTGMIKFCGGEAVHYMCDEESDWLPDIADIRSKITPKTKAIVVINPNNPTGALYPREILEGIVKLAAENGLIVFSDEVYDRLVMDGEQHVSTAAVDGAEDVLVVTFNGLSKSHMLCGYRCGWMSFSGRKDLAKDYIDGIRMLASMRLCASVPAQLIIPRALEPPYSETALFEPGGRIYEQRECIWKAVCEIPGLSAVKPKAAFYIFPKLDAKKFSIASDERFVLDFLYKHHVLMTHGRGFNYPEPDHFRIVFLPEVSVLERIGQDLRSFLESYRQQA
ncbi:MAG: pyridoxal phosphate-dependent aminotransferase [Clostridiales bacterium]|nr:pyridoxal phosphate-dependent aminotransferase [Clostridiales bacterium]